jgi:RNA polymerase sigma-70 factor (ECF subfamily)
MNAKDFDKQHRFLELADNYKSIIAKVCSIYNSPDSPFEDLYQEVMINLWTGLESFRGDAKASTWIYRLALNTCITWQRRSKRHRDNIISVPLENGIEIPDAADGSIAQVNQLYQLISLLDPFDKALLTLWLDEKSYEDISQIMGLNKANIATRLHRIRGKLAKLARQNDEL